MATAITHVSRVCRLCRETDNAGWTLIKYSTRCYAHPHCYTDRHGFESLLALLGSSRRHELRNWQIKEAQKRGLLERIMRELDKIDRICDGCGQIIKERKAP